MILPARRTFLHRRFHPGSVLNKITKWYNIGPMLIEVASCFSLL